MKQSVLYIFSSSSSGVDNKINETIFFINKLGFSTDKLDVSKCRNLFCFVWKLRSIVFGDDRIVILRSLNSLNLFIIGFIIIAKFQGKKFILDVPTPNLSVVYETIYNSKKLTRWVHVSLMLISGPWVLWFFDVVVQYGNEGRFFMIGNQKRTLFMGNGINPDRCSLRKNSPSWPNDFLNILAVAHPSQYHGFDRVIKAMYVWNFNKLNNYKVKFYLIGSSPYVYVLKELVSKFDLKEYVSFIDNQNTSFLQKFYSEAHLAISSLGLFRVKLNESSDLKSREYCLVGIPFVAAGKDLDFSGNEYFRIQVSNDDSIDDILKIFRNFPDSIPNISNQEIRDYAINNLNMEIKVKKIIDAVLMH